MKTRKVAAFLLAAVLALLAAGCQSNQEAGVTGGNTVTISVFDRGTVPASEGTYEDNRWTRWINEETGLNVEWVPINRNEAQQKLNMLIATGSAPDIMVEYDAKYIAGLVNQNIIQPIDKYVEQYSTSYKKYLEENADLKQYVTYNGEMYAFTNRRSIENVVNKAMWIRQDWLDNLGLPMPQTDEEFIETARAFTYNDPDRNGVDDTIGAALLQWQGITEDMYFASSMWYVEDGKPVYGSLVDRYADSLNFMKTLYSEKLIDEEFITDKQSTNQKRLWTTGKAGIFTNNVSEEFNRDLMKNIPSANPVPLEPVGTKYGRNGLWQEPAAQRYCVFNRKMQNPEAGVKLIDWMIDKGWFTLMFGEEGIHHRLVDGVPQVIDAEKNKTELDYAVDYGILNQWQMKPEWIPIMAAQDELSQKLAHQRLDSITTAYKNSFRRDMPYSPNVPEVTRIISEFEPKKAEIRMSVILGEPEKDGAWGLEQLRAEWERLGGAAVDELVAKWYEDNKASFN